MNPTSIIIQAEASGTEVTVKLVSPTIDVPGVGGPLTFDVSSGPIRQYSAPPHVVNPIDLILNDIEPSPTLKEMPSGETMGFRDGKAGKRILSGSS